MFDKEVIIDGKDHLVGRLASCVAKELLSGQRIVIVRCEQICKSGTLFRNKLEWKDFLRKRMNTNPRRGPYHYRAPSRVVWRTIRGMVPHKTERGAQALARLKVFEGCPPPYDNRKKRIVPYAIRQLRLRNFRPYCRLGELMSGQGWNHGDLVDRLEEKRKARAKTFFERKLKQVNFRRQAENLPALKDIRTKLQKLGF
eukprot:TRINITY_DN1301_c0_g2_i2.p3 TRINITY_DN1301_c0_g2~~TRINITY_DN1301_c0_g2_i2.p3  ORF type:complete len:199 (+),score=51.88 TRINITY_DN1301_c0_g2_i2:145-741(+)